MHPLLLLKLLSRLFSLVKVYSSFIELPQMFCSEDVRSYHSLLQVFHEVVIHVDPEVPVGVGELEVLVHVIWNHPGSVRVPSFVHLIEYLGLIGLLFLSTQVDQRPNFLRPERI